MKKYLNFRFVFVFCMVLSLILAHPLAVFADVKDLMISTDSNALMTLELDDSDYLMMSPRSSVGTVENTIDESYIIIGYTDGTYTNYQYLKPSFENGRFVFSWSLPDFMDGYWIRVVYFIIQSQEVSVNGLPSPSGVYDFSMDFSSDFSYELASKDYYCMNWESSYKYDNSIYDDLTIPLTSYSFSSGDFYVGPTAFDIGSKYWYNRVRVNIAQNDMLQNFGGSFAMRFVPTNKPGTALAGDEVSSSAQYEDNVSSSLGDLSSSVGEMTEEISGITSAIQNLQGAMEPHYDNMLTQLHHITEQLHAFWDQQFNLHHVPLMAKLSDIVDAIGNMDLEVEVNLNSLKTSIDTMSQNVQNKLQSVTDTITGGFDNSSIQNENNELSGAVDELDQAEKEVLDDVTGYIDGFEYPTFDSLSGGLLGAIAFFGGFLQSVFLAMGDFGLIITFSLTMIFVLIIVGYHRIRT